MGIYIYIYIYISHALRMHKIIIIITCTCNGSPWFSWYTAKVWHAAAFSCNLREASALMLISSNNYYPAHAQRMRRSVTDIYVTRSGKTVHFALFTEILFYFFFFFSEHKIYNSTNYVAV